MTSDTLMIAALALVCIGVLFLFIGIWWMFLNLREEISITKGRIGDLDDRVRNIRDTENEILGLKDNIMDFVLDKVDGVTISIKDESEEEEG